MRILVTGAKSGLGKYLSEQLESDTFNRHGGTHIAYEDYRYGEEYDLIIHCANNGDYQTWGAADYKFYNDNIFLTRDIARIPHKKFIHISTYDIEENTPYSACKRISETIVSDISKNYLIIRPTSLLGKDMKENTFTKILAGKPVYLTEDSVMNYITHKDVLNVIEKEYPLIFHDKLYDGVVYLCANKNIKLGEIADLVGKKIEYGDYRCEQKSIFTDYNTGRNSLDNVIKFIEEAK